MCKEEKSLDYVIYYDNMTKKEVLPLSPEEYTDQTIYYFPDIFLITRGVYEINEQYYFLQELGLYEIGEKNAEGIVKVSYFLTFDVFAPRSLVAGFLWRIELAERKDALVKSKMLEGIIHEKVDCLPLDIFRKYIVLLELPMRYLYAYSQKEQKIITTFLEIWHFGEKKWHMFDIDSGFMFKNNNFADIINHKDNCKEILQNACQIAPDKHATSFSHKEQILKDYTVFADILKDPDIILAYECVPDDVFVFTEDDNLLSIEKPARLHDVDGLLAGRGLKYKSRAELNYELYEKTKTFIFTQTVVVTTELKKEVEE